jgi:hypothetical protein
MVFLKPFIIFKKLLEEHELVLIMQISHVCIKTDIISAIKVET